MLTQKPIVRIISVHSYKSGEEFPFKVDIRVEQDDTNLNFLFLPFKGNGDLKVDHSIFLSPEGRQASKHSTSFCALSLQEATEREGTLFQDIKLLLETWLNEIEGIMNWESTHTEYDSSKVIDEEEKTE